MTSLNEQLPHTSAFPHALGTGLLLHTASKLGSNRHEQLASFIDVYESALSRFRADSPVSAARQSKHGGSFDFPDWALGLFELIDRLALATDGAIDPCVGEDLIRLGYDETYSFTETPDAAEHLGSIHGRPTWLGDVERHGTTLVTHRPVALDFGACGKGYLVDLLASYALAAYPLSPPLVIDAGGDLLVRVKEPITIALEDPFNPENAVGTATLRQGAFCASAPSRRHWGEAAGHRLHHLLNAIDGLPVNDVAATWVAVPARDATAEPYDTTQRPSHSPNTDQLPPTAEITYSTAFPTALADGLATALFTTPAGTLRNHFPFECAIVNADRTAAESPNFPGTLFH
jgi:thiamine biosynthesis lipoprotein